MHVRVLEDAPAPAAHNMAVDESLLLAADQPVLRLYGFAPAAVSLGYFQSSAEFEDVRAAGTPVVRRITGGGAIHHDDELTFSLAVDASWLPRDIDESYRVLHDAVVRALAGVGVSCRRATTGAAAAARPEHRWCFFESGRGDLVTENGKLLGSAQRRVRHDGRERILHHGSLVWRRPSWTPFTAAVADQVEPDDALRGLVRRRLVEELAACLGLHAVASRLTTAEQRLAATLVRDRYANPSFVDRR